MSDSDVVEAACAFARALYENRVEFTDEQVASFGMEWIAFRDALVAAGLANFLKDPALLVSPHTEEPNE